MTRISSTATAALVTAVLTTPAFASVDLTVVYGNITGGIAEVGNALLSEASRSIRFADEATLSTDTTIAAIQWSGLYSDGDFQPGPLDDFTITIYAESDDAFDRPGDLLATFNVGNTVTRTDTGQSAAGFLDLYEYTAHIEFPMQAGVTYWFSIANDHGAQGDTDDWFWGFDPVSGGLSASSGNSGSSWSPSTGDAFDFRLLVPAPASASLLALATIATARRRR